MKEQARYQHNQAAGWWLLWIERWNIFRIGPMNPGIMHVIQAN